jgi:hypothetical protein
MIFGVFGLEFLLYSLFGSFLEDLDINEFNKILGHCASRNDKRFLLLII